MIIHRDFVILLEQTISKLVILELETLYVERCYKYLEKKWHEESLSGSIYWTKTSWLPQVCWNDAEDAHQCEL